MLEFKYLAAKDSTFDRKNNHCISVDVSTKTSHFKSITPLGSLNWDDEITLSPPRSNSTLQATTMKTL